jgi:hypothetical protein
MRNQSISVAGIALATTFLLPQAAAAQTNIQSLAADTYAPGAHATSGVGILPISYSLTPAVAVSAVAEQSVSQQQQASSQEQQRLAANRAAWAKFHGMQHDAIRWELGYLALSAVDAAQLMNCLHAHTCHEANPIYGRHPSTARIILTKAIGGAFHFWLVNGMNKRNPREARLTAQLSAGIQGFIVAINFTGALKDN